MSGNNIEDLLERTKMYDECKKAKEDQNKNNNGFFPMMSHIYGSKSEIPLKGPLLVSGGSSAGGMFWNSNIDIFDFQSRKFLRSSVIQSGELTPDVAKVFQVDDDGDEVGLISNVRTRDYRFSEFEVLKIRNLKEEEKPKVTKFSVHPNVVCNDAVVQKGRLYTCGGDGRINIFDLSNIKDSNSSDDRKLHHFESKLIQSNICVSKSSTKLGCGHPKGFDLYDLKEMKQEFSTTVSSDRWVNASCALNEDLFVFSAGGEVFCVDSRNKNTVEERGVICESEIWSFEPLTESLFAIGENSGEVKIVDRRKNWETVLSIPKFAEDYMKVNEIIRIPSENGSLICVCNTVRIFVYDFLNGKCMGCFLPVQTANCVTYVNRK